MSTYPQRRGPRIVPVSGAFQPVLLGKGAFGAVYKIDYQGKKVALKVFLSQQDGIPYDTLHELHAYAVLKGYPHIVQANQVVYGPDPVLDAVDPTLINPESIKLLMTLHQSDLYKYGKILTFDERLNFFPQLYKQMLIGLWYISRRGIIHNDIKPDNILVDFNNAAGPQFYIGDFGVIEQVICGVDQGVIRDRYGGTEHYMSPEVLDFRSYTTKTDVWSMGVTFLHFLLGRADKYISQLVDNPDAIFDAKQAGLIVNDHIDIEKYITKILGSGYYNKINPAIINNLNRMLTIDKLNRASINDLVGLDFEDTAIPLPVYSRWPQKSTIDFQQYTAAIVKWLDFVDEDNETGFFRPQLYAAIINIIDLFDRYLANAFTPQPNLYFILLACYYTYMNFIALSKRINIPYIMSLLKGTSLDDPQLLISFQVDLVKAVNSVMQHCGTDIYINTVKNTIRYNPTEDIYLNYPKDMRTNVKLLRDFYSSRAGFLSEIEYVDVSEQYVEYIENLEPLESEQIAAGQLSKQEQNKIVSQLETKLADPLPLIRGYDNFANDITDTDYTIGHYYELPYSKDFRLPKFDETLNKKLRIFLIPLAGRTVLEIDQFDLDKNMVNRLFRLVLNNEDILHIFRGAIPQGNQKIL